MYFVDGQAILRLDAQNKVTLIAGSNATKPSQLPWGGPAGLGTVHAMVADGQGALYAAVTWEGRKHAIIVKVQLISSCSSSNSGASSRFEQTTASASPPPPAST